MDHEIIESSPRSYAYVTLLAGDGDYVKGVVCLAKGLRKAQAAYPLVVAVLPDVREEHRNMLLNQGCILRQIDHVSNKESSFARAYCSINYCKLQLWKFAEYRKMIYMDADIQVLANIDNLFDLPSGCFYAVMDCLCEMGGQTCPQVVPCPQELVERPPFYLNCGMFLFEPCLDTYARLFSTLDVTPLTPLAEQDSARPIHQIYNLLVAMIWRHPEHVEFDVVKVVHFCVTGSKPWQHTGEGEHMEKAHVKMLGDRWWEIYNDSAMGFPCNGASSQVSG